MFKFVNEMISDIVVCSGMSLSTAVMTGVVSGSAVANGFC